MRKFWEGLCGTRCGSIGKWTISGKDVCWTKNPVWKSGCFFWGPPWSDLGRRWALRIANDDDFAVVVPSSLKYDIINYVHGSKLIGHYRKRRTMARMRGKYWWASWVKDLMVHINNSIPWTVAEDRKHGMQARMEVAHPKRWFSHPEFDIHSIRSKTARGSTNVLGVVYVITRYVRAVPKNR